MTKAAITQRVDVQCEVFGARGCSSCTCDPCDCNPCTCGDSLLPSYPRWRVSGYSITQGEIQGIDVSGRLLVSLAQPLHAEIEGAWQETLLVEEQATPEQIEALLILLERDLKSIPAEVNTYTRKQRAVYKIPLHYSHTEEATILQATFDRGQAILIREGTDSHPLEGWYYDGPMALRGLIALRN